MEQIRALADPLLHWMWFDDDVSSETQPQKRLRRADLRKATFENRLSTEMLLERAPGTCPSGYAYYVCSGGFTGCCSIDPCSSTGCPTGNIPPTSSASSGVTSATSTTASSSTSSASSGSSSIATSILSSLSTSPSSSAPSSIPTSAYPSSASFSFASSPSSSLFTSQFASVSSSLSTPDSSSVPSSSTSTPSSSAVNSTSSHGSTSVGRHNIVGATVGGVIGGLIALVLIILCLILARRKHRRRAEQSSSGKLNDLSPIDRSRISRPLEARHQQSNRIWRHDSTRSRGPSLFRSDTFRRAHPGMPIDLGPIPPSPASTPPFSPHPFSPVGRSPLSPSSPPLHKIHPALRHSLRDSLRDSLRGSLGGLKPLSRRSRQPSSSIYPSTIPPSPLLPLAGHTPPTPPHTRHGRTASSPTAAVVDARPFDSRSTSSPPLYAPPRVPPTLALRPRVWGPTPLAIPNSNNINVNNSTMESEWRRRVQDPDEVPLSPWSWSSRNAPSALSPSWPAVVAANARELWGESVTRGASGGGGGGMEGRKGRGSVDGVGLGIEDGSGVRAKDSMSRMRSADTWSPSSSESREDTRGRGSKGIGLGMEMLPVSTFVHPPRHKLGNMT